MERQQKGSPRSAVLHAQQMRLPFLEALCPNRTLTPILLEQVTCVAAASTATRVQIFDLFTWAGMAFKKSHNFFFHSSAAKPNYDKPQKTGRLFSRKYEFGTPVRTWNLSKLENRDFLWLLSFGSFRVSKTCVAFLQFL